jgi:glycosyltransferase involved in cell wall biosynthesis
MKVSVVVAAYNMENEIVPSLQSLLCQTLQDMEVIVVNDGSTDRTSEQVRSLAESNPRLKLIDLTKNVGVYSARSVGIKAAQGSWVGFLDADDFADPAMFNRLYQVAIEQDADVVLCQSNRVDTNRRKIGPKVRFGHSRLVTDNILNRFCSYELGTGALWNKLFKAELIKKWGTVEHDWRQDTNEDSLINLGIFRSAKRVYLLAEYLHEYSFNPKSVTSTKKNEEAYILLMKAFILALKLTSRHGFSDSEKSDVIHFYRIQLNMGDYHLDNFKNFVCDDRGFLKIYSDAVNQWPMEMLALNSRLPEKKRASLARRIARYGRAKLLSK